jgi:hypothetical protein
MDWVSIKHTIIFQRKTLQNLPKFGFWFENKPSAKPAIQYDFELTITPVWKR